MKKVQTVSTSAIHMRSSLVFEIYEKTGFQYSLLTLFYANIIRAYSIYRLDKIDKNNESTF